MHRSRSARVERRTAAWRCLLIGLPLAVLSACQDARPDRPAAAAAPVAPQAAAQVDPEEASAAQGVPEGGAPKKAEPEANTTVASADKYPLQDNPLAGCSLCHVDVEDEFAGTRHFEEKVGCKTCHGPSEAHLADENNEVRPDELFRRENVDELCSRCHECGRLEVAGSAVGDDGQPRVCSDCHGHHALVLTRENTDGPGYDR